MDQQQNNKPEEKIKKKYFEWDWKNIIFWLIVAAIIRFIVGGVSNMNDYSTYKPVNNPIYEEMDNNE